LHQPLEKRCGCLPVGLRRSVRRPRPRRGTAARPRPHPFGAVPAAPDRRATVAITNPPEGPTLASSSPSSSSRTSAPRAGHDEQVESW
jgi:hypothetical protein